jgi:hypothetical protein
MRALSVLVTILVGLIVLLGYFLPVLVPIQNILLNWAVILAGVAALLGVFNLISVHGDKIRRRETGFIYSVLLIITLVAVFVFGMVLGPEHVSMRILVNGVILPAEAALMGLLSVSLLYAAVRLMRRRPDLMSSVFLITVVIVLLGSASLPFGDIPVLGSLVRPWITEVLALGGARGILMGVALGTLMTGLRILFAVDRPYGGK